MATSDGRSTSHGDEGTAKATESKSTIHTPHLSPVIQAGLQTDGRSDEISLVGDLTGLEAWIARLPDRLARGELDGVGLDGIDGAAMLGTATVARIMIAELDHLIGLPPDQRREPLVMARWLHLLGDLWALRATVG